MVEGLDFNQDDVTCTCQNLVNLDLIFVSSILCKYYIKKTKQILNSFDDTHP